MNAEFSDGRPFEMLRSNAKLVRENMTLFEVLHEHKILPSGGVILEHYRAKKLVSQLMQRRVSSN